MRDTLRFTHDEFRPGFEGKRWSSGETSRRVEVSANERCDARERDAAPNGRRDATVDASLDRPEEGDDEELVNAHCNERITWQCVNSSRPARRLERLTLRRGSASAIPASA